MDMISVRQAPELAPRAIAYFQRHWATAETLMMYEDAINRSIGASNPLPQWYLLMENDQILGCVGLITNDFISRGEALSLAMRALRRGNAARPGLRRQTD